MRKNREIKLIFVLLAVFFAGFLAVPMLSVVVKSFTGDGSGISLAHYAEILTGRGFLRAMGNSLLISVCSALITTVLAFILAYTIHYTNLGKRYKGFICRAAVLPMLLPTITYGFAIIYSFGKQGLLTQLFGRQLFNIYGFNGLLLGYVVYTLPIAFTLINNAMGYIDKRFMIVSRLMGDSPLQTFRMTILIPLLGTLATSFIQTFFLCFTDFGIPASVGGQFEVVASVLYTEMLGSVPNFGNGAVVALVMIIPSVVSITVLHILEKYNVRYNRISPIEIRKSAKRDVAFGILSAVILVCTLCMFLVMFIVPFIEEWPYRINFTMEHVQAVFGDRQLCGVYLNSLMVAVITALAGTLMSLRCGAGDGKEHGQRESEESDRQHRTCDKHDPGYGHRSFLPVCVYGNSAAEYLSDHHHMQHRAFLFYAVSDDEKLALQDERILGDDGNAHGGTAGSRLLSGWSRRTRCPRCWRCSATIL